MKTVHIPKKNIDATLINSPVKGKNLLEPFRTFALQNKLPFSILEDTAVENDAEVHVKEGDLWFGLEGEAIFVCGGELVEPKCRLNSDGTENHNELYAKEIADGEKFIVKAGDWLWIPAGDPHQHSAIGTARLVIIKIPAL
ncbi:MAG: hypothetical protein UX89_C0001G0002 [Parcubacteria group bacterium GW2011_GWA2_47_16]|nr:MAG: hypothetical protein UX89_C0001G0002 [Parcubacteria group bacterium GW2011_GWA2_47_16]